MASGTYETVAVEMFAMNDLLNGLTTEASGGGGLVS